jgi:hypothetical protein
MEPVPCEHAEATTHGEASMKMKVVFLGALVILPMSMAAAAKVQKVDVCHVPPDAPEDRQTLQVPAQAVPAHVAHGDIACSCEVIDDCAEQGGILNEETCECEVGGVCEADWECGDEILECGTGDEPFPLCVCDVTVEGDPFCWDDTDCADTPPCDDTSDCAAGWACVTTCCGQTCFPECANPGEISGLQLTEEQLTEGHGPTGSGQ